MECPLSYFRPEARQPTAGGSNAEAVPESAQMNRKEIQMDLGEAGSEHRLTEGIHGHRSWSVARMVILHWPTLTVSQVPHTIMPSSSYQVDTIPYPSDTQKNRQTSGKGGGCGNHQVGVGPTPTGASQLLLDNSRGFQMEGWGT